MIVPLTLQAPSDAAAAPALPGPSLPGASLPGAAAASVPPVVVDPSFNAAKHLYAEMFGDAIVTATYLKLVVAALSLIVAALVYTQYRTSQAISAFQPLVIRVDQVGRAEAVRYGDFAYTPQEAEIKYFLSEFCRLYYSRNRQSLPGNFRKALAYLSPQLAEGIIGAWDKQHVVEEYVRSPLGDIDVDITSVAIEDLRQQPLKARVDFYQVYYSIRDRIEAKKALYTVNFTFRFRSGVLPPQVMAVNPLGLTIDYFREDHAIK
jgi:type IV secretory pathway TrbF-like protein